MLKHCELFSLLSVVQLMMYVLTGDVIAEPILQWSLGKKVSSPPATGSPAKVDMSNSPCSRDVKVLVVQFTTGCTQCAQSYIHYA